jgi:hypothetical protein
MTATQKAVRAVAFVLLGLGIALLLNMTVWSGQAKASDCSNTWGGRWGDDAADCYWEDLTSPDARQLYGNAASAAAVGWAGGGPVGAAWASLGAALGSIPWDGTWD